MTLSYAVDFRGHPACPCQAKWLPVYEAELQRRRALTAEASGGTHATGGASDFWPNGDIGVAVWVARQMGADATWYRPYNWDGDGGSAHIHSVLTNCPHNSPARYQIDAVRAGLNGLANHGPDTGPRPLSGRTWQEGIAWAQALEDDMTPQQEATLNRVASDVADLKARVNEIAGNVAKRDAALRTEMRKRLKATDAEIDEVLAAVEKS